MGNIILFLIIFLIFIRIIDLCKHNKKEKKSIVISIVNIIIIVLICNNSNNIFNHFSNKTLANKINEADLNKHSTNNYISLENIPAYKDKPYVIINNNNPFFDENMLNENSYEEYSKLDNLGRCGVALANIGKDLMPTKERESIGSVKPTGWHTIKYDNVEGKYLYNRVHLIGYQLTGENANKRNLITGTRYLNIKGMLPFENMVADYIKETNNHVLYRVTPIFKDDNLVASGVLMEGKSVEDNGDGILFNVYCYNVSPGIKIDYKNGNSSKICS